jgi:hypothetical protein
LGPAGLAGGRLERIPEILHCTRLFQWSPKGIARGLLLPGETDPKPFGKDYGLAGNEIYIDVVVVARIASARCFKTGNGQTYEVQ